MMVPPGVWRQRQSFAVLFTRRFPPWRKANDDSCNDQRHGKPEGGGHWFIQARPRPEHGENGDKIVEEQRPAGGPVAQGVIPDAQANNGPGEDTEELPADEARFQRGQLTGELPRDKRKHQQTSPPSGVSGIGHAADAARKAA